MLLKKCDKVAKCGLLVFGFLNMTFPCLQSLQERLDIPGASERGSQSLVLSNQGLKARLPSHKENMEADMVLSFRSIYA